MVALKIIPILYIAGLALAGPSQDSPEISRSVGQDGGVVIMWPRIIPKSERANTRDLAASLRGHLRKLRLKKEWVTFREPPESQVQIIDYAKCSQVISKLSERERYVLEAIQTAATPATEGK